MIVTVLVKEIHLQAVSIKANSNEEAMSMVINGEGEEVGDPYFYETMNPETWTVCNPHGNNDRFR